MADIHKVIRVGDTLTNIIDSVTKKSVNYKKVTTWYDGSSMTNEKVDGILYRKKGNEFFRQVIDKEGELFLEKDTMAQMRALSPTEILFLKAGVYKGVRLNGYHANKPKYSKPIQYTLSNNTSILDDGGSVVIVGNIVLIHEFVSEINVKYFGAIGNGVDNDTSSIQNAVNYTNRITPTSYFYGSTLYFPKGDYLVRNLNLRKPGYKFVGDGNKNSRIVGDTEITVTVRPLLGDNPFTNSGFGGFFMEDIGIYAISDLARESGTGLKMINCFVTQQNNLYVAGFKKNIELVACHYNVFTNFYAADEKTVLTNPNEEIFNRGYAISVSDEEVSGEAGASGLHIKGGWLHNTSLNLQYTQNAIVENIDIEPASNPFIVGSNGTFRNNRFERMDYFAVHANPPKYPNFNWIIVEGNYNKFYENDIHENGAQNIPFVNAKIKVNGDNNVISFERKFVHFGLLDFSPTSKGNVLELGRFADEELFAETTSKNYNMERIDGMYEGINTINLKEYFSNVKIVGRKTKEIVNCSSVIDKMNSGAFIQGATKVGNVFTVTDEAGKRIIMNFDTPYAYEKGVYCLIFRLKSNLDGKTFRVYSNYTNNSYAGIKASNKDGLYAFRFSIVADGQLIMPAIYFDNGFQVGDTFEISEVELLKMDDGEYTEEFYVL